MARKKRKETLLKYPGATLAIVSLFTVVFSAGIAWATQSSRLSRLENDYVHQTELETLKGLIKALQEKVDDKFSSVEKTLNRIEEKVYQ